MCENAMACKPLGERFNSKVYNPFILLMSLNSGIARYIGSASIRVIRTNPIKVFGAVTMALVSNSG